MMATWREEMAEIMDTAFGAPEVANGTLGDLASVAQTAQARLVEMVERRGVSVMAGEVEVHWSAGMDEVEGTVEMDPRVVAELDEKAKPHLRLVEPVEDEPSEPQLGAASMVMAAVEAMDLPPVPEGHRRAVLVTADASRADQEAIAQRVAEAFGPEVRAVVVPSGSKVEVLDLPPVEPGHKRLAVVAAHVDREAFVRLSRQLGDFLGGDAAVVHVAPGESVDVRDVPKSEFAE